MNRKPGLETEHLQRYCCTGLGKAPLDFLNCLIYLKGTPAFNDITTGSNPECDTQGFQCCMGWDPGNFKHRHFQLHHLFGFH